MYGYVNLFHPKSDWSMAQTKLFGLWSMEPNTYVIRLHFGSWKSFTTYDRPVNVSERE